MVWLIFTEFFDHVDEFDEQWVVVEWRNVRVVPLICGIIESLMFIWDYCIWSSWVKVNNRNYHWKTICMENNNFNNEINVTMTHWQCCYINNHVGTNSVVFVIDSHVGDPRSAADAEEGAVRDADQEALPSGSVPTVAMGADQSEQRGQDPTPPLPPHLDTLTL